MCMEWNAGGLLFIVIVSTHFPLKQYGHLWHSILSVITIRNMASLPMCKAQPDIIL